MSTCKYRALFLALAFCFGVSVATGFAGTEDQPKPDHQIEVRLRSKTTTVQVGETLEIRVEIRNVGNKELFIEKNVYDACTRSPLSLYLESRPPLKVQGPGMACAADCLDDPTETITNRLLERWISLPVGHFYGAAVRMDPDFFPE